MDLETIKRELAERVMERTVELHKDLTNPLAVTNVILLEELARLELRMRALARAAYACAPFGLEPDLLRAIADGKDLP